MQYGGSPFDPHESVAPRSNRRLALISIAVVGLIGVMICCIGAIGFVYLRSNDLTDVAQGPTATPVQLIGTSTSVARTTPGKKPTSTETPRLTPTIPPLPQPKPLKMNSPEYGVQVFLWWRPETADRDLGLAKDAGLAWVKQTFAWRDIEGSKKGGFDWQNADRAVYLANAKGIDLMARMDNAPDWAAPGCFVTEKKQMGPARNMQDWLDFLKAFVTRYKGRIRGYEIWNEPNLAREWCGRLPNPAEYAALLKASYQTIKAIDPNALVLSAGLTPTSANNADAMPDDRFVGQMYDAMKNNSNGYFDALGVHAPGYKAPPEMSPDEVAKNPAYNNGEPTTGRVYSFRHVEDIRNIMVARGDGAKQIVISEFGWTTDPIHPAYSWFKVDEQTQAKYIVGAFQYAKGNWAPWIGGMFVIYLANPDWTENNEEYWWSITKPDGTPRGAYVRIKAMAK